MHCDISIAMSMDYFVIYTVAKLFKTPNSENTYKTQIIIIIIILSNGNLSYSTTINEHKAARSKRPN